MTNETELCKYIVHAALPQDKATPQFRHHCTYENVSISSRMKRGGLSFLEANFLLERSDLIIRVSPAGDIS
jgi:hypothetical protein